MFRMENRVRYSEVDRNKKITLPAIINYFQDCSIFQSEDLGVGLQHLEQNKKAWLLSAWQIIVKEYVTMGADIKVSTWANGFQSLYGSRNFTMEDENGKCVAYANSIWVLMDLESQRPIKLCPKDVEMYEVFPAIEMEVAPRRIKTFQDSVRLDSFPVRKYHIDTNEHVNNCQYVQMAMEVLPIETAQKQVRVEYRTPAVYGDIILPKYASDEKRTVVELCNMEEKPFAIVEFISEGILPRGEQV